MNIVQQRVQEAAKEKGQASLVFRDSHRRAEETWSHPSNSSSQWVDRSQRPRTVLSSENTVRTVLAGESLQDDTLSTSIKLVFSRAANLIRESIGAERVMFLDANSDRFGSFVNRTSRKVSPSSKYPTSGSDESTASESSSKHKLSGEPDCTFVSNAWDFRAHKHLVSMMSREQVEQPWYRNHCSVRLYGDIPAGRFSLTTTMD